jgi:hypothetical protein
VTDEGLTQGGQWNLTLDRYGEDPSWVVVSGLITGKRNVDDYVHISTSIPSDAFEGTGAQYSMYVAPNQSFMIVVAELNFGPAPTSAQGRSVTFDGWTAFAQAPLDGPGALDLGLLPPGQSLTTSTSQGILNVPAGMEGASGNVFVSNVGSGRSMFLGAATSVEPVPGSTTTLEYEVQWVSPVQDLVTTYELAQNGAFTAAVVDGPPLGLGSSTLLVSFVAPPAVASPTPLYGRIQMENIAPGAKPSLSFDRDGEGPAWRIYDEGPSPGATSMFTVPHLPSSIDPRLVLGTGNLHCEPIVCIRGASGGCSAYAYGTPAEVVLP